MLVLCPKHRIIVKIINIGTDWLEQTVQTQEQADQGQQCLLFHLHLLDVLLQCFLSSTVELQ